MMSQMKDTSVEWIGSIPENWEVSRLKTVLVERNETNNPVKTDFILSLTNDRGVIPYTDKGDIGNKSKDDISSYKLAYPNDIVLNSMNVIIGSVALSSYFGCVSPVYYMLYKRKKDDDIRFYNYVFQTKELQNALKGYGNGIMEIRMRIQMLKLNTVLLPIPPANQQKHIANYLDDKCSKIDAIIAIQQEIIDNLKAYKQSTITEAVTKGLDLNAEMRDSGVEWVGCVPKHWNVISLKRIFVSRDGGAWGEDQKGDRNDRICIRIADFDYPKLRLKNNDSFTIRNYSNQIISKLSLQKNDILVEKSGGGDTTPVGRSIIFNLEIDAIYANFIDRLRCSNENYPKFIHYYLAALYSNKITYKYVKQTTGIQNLDISSFFSKENIAIPNYNEQVAIAEKLDSFCITIDRIIDDKISIIEKTELYKKSLIYEIVTGKKEV